ncbi:MAG: M66 family metalloprotease, partial [Minicystis sp.]
MTTFRPARLQALLLGALSLVACNTVTGVDDLVLQESRGTTGSGQGAGDPTGGAGGAGQGGAASTGETTGTGVPDPPPEKMVPAEGANITKISLYQGVERKLMEKGATSSSKTPIVEKRAALLRVFFSVDAAYDKSPVTARLTLDDGAPLEVVRTLSGTSKDASLSTSINFDIPAERMLAGMHYRVELLQPSTVSGGNNAAASFPASGTAALTVQSVGASLKVKLVPITYKADGSNRKPDTSAAQLQKYKDTFYGFYPIPAIELLMHAPLSWSQSIDPNGNGWDELLTAIAQLRAQDGAPAEVYYYGIFSPASSANQYCNGGCVAGLGMVASPQDSYSHAAIGLGFSGDIATETAVHEIGHTQGRNHAPCGGAQGVDPGYPYAGAKIGVWGYDLVSKHLLSPTTTTDMMGYCSPIWISDYTFTAIFKRIKLVNNADFIYPEGSLDRTYERVRIDAQGNATWLE